VFDGLASVITIPPLRLRPADAVALQRFCLRRAGRRLQAEGLRLELTPEAARAVQVSGAPGNRALAWRHPDIPHPPPTRTHTLAASHRWHWCLLVAASVAQR
jgi:hypothetical protein